MGLILRDLSPNPIGVINRRNGCGPTVAVRQVAGIVSHETQIRRFPKPAVAVRQVAGIVSHREREFNINY
ncbi:MAG: hypothetical protein ACOX79_08795 [Methanosarcina sp.]